METPYVPGQPVPMPDNPLCIEILPGPGLPLITVSDLGKWWRPGDVGLRPVALPHLFLEGTSLVCHGAGNSVSLEH